MMFRDQFVRLAFAVDHFSEPASCRATQIDCRAVNRQLGGSGVGLTVPRVGVRGSTAIFNLPKGLLDRHFATGNPLKQVRKKRIGVHESPVFVGGLRSAGIKSQILILTSNK